MAFTQIYWNSSCCDIPRELSRESVDDSDFFLLDAHDRWMTLSSLEKNCLIYPRCLAGLYCHDDISLFFYFKENAFSKFYIVIVRIKLTCPNNSEASYHFEVKKAIQLKNY